MSLTVYERRGTTTWHKDHPSIVITSLHRHTRSEIQICAVFDLGGASIDFDELNRLQRELQKEVQSKLLSYCLAVEKLIGRSHVPGAPLSEVKINAQNIPRRRNVYMRNKRDWMTCKTNVIVAHFGSPLDPAAVFVYNCQDRGDYLYCFYPSENGPCPKDMNHALAKAEPGFRPSALSVTRLAMSALNTSE